MSTSSPEGTSYEIYGSDEDDDLQRAIAESLSIAESHEPTHERAPGGSRRRPAGGRRRRRWRSGGLHPSPPASSGTRLHVPPASPMIPPGFFGVDEDLFTRVDQEFFRNLFGVEVEEGEADTVGAFTSYESASDSSASTDHHVDDAGDDDISQHQSTIIMAVVGYEESSDKILAQRLSSWEDFMKKVKVGDKNARASFEDFNSESLNIETTENSWPTQDSEILSQTSVRIGELRKMKQTLQGDNAALAPAFHARMKAVEDEEVQSTGEILRVARSKETQQKKLSEIDERCQQTILEIRQRCNNECMESLKAAREEKGRLFQQWASSRQARLSSWERTARNTKEMQLELMPAIIKALEKRGQDGRTNVHTGMAINATQSSCCVCTEEIEGTGPSRSSGCNIKKRGCFYPCMHATTCLDCAIQIWESGQTCPNCRGTLACKPSALHL